MSMRFWSRPLTVLLLALLASCSGKDKLDAEQRVQQVLAKDWAAIEAEARGQTVTWGMWQGDPFINDYVAQFVVPEVKKRYGIDLKVVGAQGNEIVSMLMTELEAGKDARAYDMVWINGETFYQLREINALLGPFTAKLPNTQYIDAENPFIRYDFQRDTNGYESPWGNVQLTLIYDSRRVSNPPRDMAELEAWVREHPGRFTFDNFFTGMTFLKSLLISLAGGPGSLDGQFDEQRYRQASTELWQYLNRIKPYLWRKGETFPDQVTQLNQLFAAGEIDFTMSNNDGEVDNKVLQGLFNDSARGYVLSSGTIQNTHYIGIPRSSAQIGAAMVVANFLISPEAQFEKLKPAIWGDGTVLDVTRLPAPWPERFANVPQRTHVPSRAELQPMALREPAPEYMVRIQRDFRKYVIDGAPLEPIGTAQ
jgi:putative spermidine/putrescine transport system substrate-binding protein